MVTVSVAMATFNGAGFIAEQLASIRRQTRPPDELVVTDDGSSDETLAIIEQFAAQSAFPVRIIRNPVRLGYRANFMTNFSQCRSDIIAVSDQDDIWDSRKLEMAVAAFSDPEVLLFCHDAWLVDAAGETIGEADVIKLPPHNPPLSFYPLSNPLGFAIVFRRSLQAFADLWQFSTDTWEPGNRMAHDQWLSFIAAVFGTTVFSDEKLVLYRQHAGNAYGWKKTSFWAGYADKLRNPGMTFRMQSNAAAARAAVLERSFDELHESWRERGERAAKMYRRYADRMALRAGIYLGNNSLANRVSAIRTLLRDGSYSGATAWELSRKALAKDLVLGTILRPLLTRPPDSLKPSALRADLKIGA